MTNVIVVGSQWGDEGKGKIVDWLSLQADVIVRFQGGHNAGHTLVINGTTYKLSILPSGIVRKNKICLIGGGVVLDPWAFIEEIKKLREQGVEISPSNLMVSEQATLILPFHRNLDNVRENAARKGKIGTTGRGIGPAYEDKIGRRAIRFGDLAEPNTLKLRINGLLFHHNAILRGMGMKEIVKEEVYQQISEIIPEIIPYSAPVWQILNEFQDQNKKILFEGAQGTMLDIDHGTYPYVTSSNTISAQAATGSGLGPNAVNYVLGIVKAYTTRVGEGPFPTELSDNMGEVLRDRGREIGTVTGRSRRCGWFDAVLVRQAVKINGFSSVALTKLDVLDGVHELQVCIAYKLDGKIIDYLPSSIADQKKVEPVYETIKGWDQAVYGKSSWNDLPEACKLYLKRIEELIGTRVSVISTSPERDHTILLSEPFQK